MATAQAALIDTIVGMKRALAREADASDSDETIYQSTNRGNKLKRKARYVHEGQLDRPNGPRVYKRKIEHAGYQRYIIGRNPPRLDEDGDELDDEDVDEEADAAAAESNPYADIKLEHLLAPLTSVADLPNHPTLSKPYLSNSIPKLTEQASILLRKEKAALWRMKQLLTKFRGDETWVPCGMFETSNDIILFEPSYTVVQQVRSPVDHIQKKATPEDIQQHQQVIQVGVEEGANESQGATKDVSSARQEDTETKAEKSESNGDVAVNEPGKETSELIETEQKTVEQTGNVPQGAEKPQGDQHQHPQHLAPADTTISQQENPPEEPVTAVSNGVEQNTAQETSKDTHTDTHLPSPQAQSSLKPTATHSQQPDPEPPNDTKAPLVVEEEQTHSPTQPQSQPTSHRMTTRLRAQATNTAASNSPGPSPDSPNSTTPTYPIHPIFLLPPSARPDRDFGLPPVEAEETRRLLMLYVQKQEEVCRGSWRLYEGLLKADRLRKTVFRWAKAEAHVGEMSDGEDWYDKEEWGLEEDLKKGHDEDEDDAGGGGGGSAAIGAGGGTGAAGGNERGKKTRTRRA